MIELQEVSKIYRRSAGDEVQALVDVSLHIGRGEFVAIVGASGSGKSTLMNIIGLLDVPTAGRYRFDGVDVTAFNANDQANTRNRKIGFVFQAFHLLPREFAPRRRRLRILDWPPRRSARIEGLRSRRAHQNP